MLIYPTLKLSPLQGMAGMGGGIVNRSTMGAGGAVYFPPFTLTLDASNASRLGDTTSVQNTWWGTQTYDSNVITNIGQQSYQGFYAFTVGIACNLSATLGGAAGWGNSRGRSISATFSLSVGDRIVFFAGKPTVKLTYGQQVGAAGGASCLMIYDTSLTSDNDYSNGFVPWIIAAGGSASGSTHSNTAANWRQIEAVPLSTTGSASSIYNFRSGNGYHGGYTNNSGFDGGIGRNGIQTGGCGWKYGPAGQPNANPQYGSVRLGLSYGAEGCPFPTASGGSGIDGGFGGGGGDADANYYSAGGGGYFGGYESHGGDQSGSAYFAYYGPSLSDDRLGPLSFVHTSGTSVSDNGHHGTGARADQNNANQIKGRVELTFNP